MLKHLFFLAILISLFPVSAQPNTEVYLMDLEFSETESNFSNFRNISSNEGYDSQQLLRPIK